jgi:OOP family OmpA-OmpF porin
MSQHILAASHCIKDIVNTHPMVAGVTMGMVIDFDVNSADIKVEYHKELAKAATFLKNNKTVHATVEGHTANVQTTPALAQEISHRRAQNVVNYLVDLESISRSRLTAEGSGQSHHYAYNTHADDQQKNRRVNIIFSYPK